MKTTVIAMALAAFLGLSACGSPVPAYQGNIGPSEAAAYVQDAKDALAAVKGQEGITEAHYHVGRGEVVIETEGSVQAAATLVRRVWAKHDLHLKRLIVKRPNTSAIIHSRDLINNGAGAARYRALQAQTVLVDGGPASEEVKRAFASTRYNSSTNTYEITR